MVIGGRTLNKRTAIFVIIAAAALLTAIILAFALPPEADAATTRGRVEYLAALGWEVDPQSEQREAILLPREFGEVLAEYNELQKSQGFDLSQYAGTDCLRYTYRVLNYPNSGETVLAQLFIRGSKVIAGDIHSTAMDGFMHSLR